MTPEEMLELARELRRVKRSTDHALVDAGCTLRRAKSEAGMESWPALVATCGLTPERVRMFIQLAGELEASVRAPAAALEVPTVVCGWCAHTRAGQGLPPKHLCGPAESARVVHDVCPECEAALDRRLDQLRKGSEGSPKQRSETLAVFHAEEWTQARTRLKAVLHFVDRARDEVLALADNENVGVRDGVMEEFEHLDKALGNVRRLSAEMVLISEREQYDQDALGTEPHP